MGIHYEAGRVVKKHKLLPEGRFVLGIFLCVVGAYVTLYTAVAWSLIGHYQAFRVVTETKERTVYKELPVPPVPPEPGYDTGNVTVTVVWYRTDPKMRKTNDHSGQYQVETPDGIVSLISFCSLDGVFPDFAQGDRVNIHLVGSSGTECSKFVRARRWK